jgi:hypothetical protein
VVVYVPVSLQGRMKRASSEDSTYTDLVLTAIDATHDRLSQVFGPQSPAAGSLFTGHRRRRRRHAEPIVQVPIRPLESDLKIIDRLVAECQAPSRSALVSTALDLFLPQAAAG